MASQPLVDQIKRVTHEHPGYSFREGKLWERLAENCSIEEQEEVLKFLKEHSKKLPPDLYDIYDQKGVLDQLELAFFEAQTQLSSKSEQKQLFEMLTKNGKKRQPSAKIIDKTLESLKNKEDITKLLMALGPEGIQELEEGLVNLYLSKGLVCTLNQLLEALNEYTYIKNVLTQANIKFMEDIIEIYTNVINQLNEQRSSALKRAEYIIQEFLKQN